MRWRTVLLIVLLLVLAGAGWLAWTTRPRPVLTLATWAGPYARAQADAMVHPYEAQTRIFVRLADYGGGLSALRRQVADHHYDWDVVDLELPEAVAACDAHLLEPITPAMLPPGATGPDAGDFVPGAIGPCWIGSVVYSQVIAYAPGRFGGAAPRQVSDFFDLERFPGKRGLNRNHAKFNLELALLADGVEPKNVYRVLGTPAGLARALAKLDTIRTAIVWYGKSREAMARLATGAVAMTTVLNGDAFAAIATHHQPARILWDRQLYELDVFAIARGNPKKAQAMAFIRFATSAAALARMADWLPYGPARRAALPLVGRNPETGLAMTSYLPSEERNFRTAFAVNDDWWNSHGKAVEAKWQAWLAGANAARLSPSHP
jgi:putative spermidine/putrescine transport system substrate-binding protein